MNIIEGIEITDRKFRRSSDKKEITAIIPNKELGYYRSLLKLKSLGYDVENLCELAVMEMNKKIFKELK